MVIGCFNDHVNIPALSHSHTHVESIPVYVEGKSDDVEGKFMRDI